MAKKDVERAFLEAARGISTVFPAGEIIDFEGPDFILKGEAGSIGIEVTQLFQPSRSTRFSPKEVESFYYKVVRRAEELYQGSDGRPVDVTVYFSNAGAGRRDVDGVARSLAEFVSGHYSPGQPSALFRSGDPDAELPNGPIVVNISTPTGSSGVWWSGVCGETIALSRDLLSSIIAGKNGLVPRYSVAVSRLWLLVVASLFPLSGSFSVPRQVESWRLLSTSSGCYYSPAKTRRSGNSVAFEGDL